jgi:hypothetical protein
MKVRGRAARVLRGAIFVFMLRPVVAQGTPPPSSVAKADALFKEERRLMAAGAASEACKKFADSQALEHRSR